MFLFFFWFSFSSVGGVIYFILILFGRCRWFLLSYFFGWQIPLFSFFFDRWRCGWRVFLFNFLSFIYSFFSFSFFFSGSWRLFIRGGLPSSRCDVSIPERGFFPVALSFPPGRWRWCQVGGACLFFWWSRSLVYWIYIRLLQTIFNGDIDSSAVRLHLTSGAPSSNPHPCIAVFL